MKARREERSRRMRSRRDTGGEEGGEEGARKNDGEEGG